MTELKQSDMKLIQYLNEAHGKEKELEMALQAHITMAADRPPYKKRLQQHLKETKDHARQLERRIKALGGKADSVPDRGTELVAEAAGAVQTAIGKAAATAKGPLHALRGTGVEEKMLKNAKTEYFNEAEEIATYTAIEALADAVGDKETAKMARSIRRDEERMRDFLGRLIPQLTKAVARAEIPAAERNGSGGRSRSRASSARSKKSSSSSSARKSPSASRKSSSASRKSSGTRKRATAKA